MDDRRSSDPVPADEQRAADPTAAHASATEGGPSDTTTPLTPVATSARATPPPVALRRPSWRFAPTLVALVIAFVWGGITYKELGPKATAYLPAPVVSAADGSAVLGAESPPGWVSDFAKAFCGADAQALAGRLGPPLTGQVDRISQALSQRDWSCSDMRYIGGGTDPKGTFYVYLMRDDQNNAQEWWVFTTMNDQVIAIE